VLAKLGESAKQADRGIFRLDRFNIGPRLSLCFVFIILGMLLGNAVLLWQFHQIQAQTERLSGVDQELIVVLQAHANLMSFYERVDALAHSENTAELAAEAEPLRNNLLDDSRRTRNALSRLPPEVQLDPTVLPTIETIQEALPAELEAITNLAKTGDWQAVRLRVVNQIRALESRTALLVETIDREVSEKRAHAFLEIGQARRRILFIVPITAVLTLLFAALLGLAITRSITRPLGRLMEGSRALASGDFSHRVPAAGKDEIAVLGNVFNDMIVRLQELYRELQRRGSYLAEAQKLSHTGSFGWDILSGEIYWSDETFRIFEYDSVTKPTVEMVIERTHPEDRVFVRETIESSVAARRGFDFEHRLMMPNGLVKYVRAVCRPSTTNESDGSLFVGAVTDISESRRAEQALRRSESYLTEAQRLTHTGSWVWEVLRRDTLHLSEEWYRIYEFDPEQGMPRWEKLLQRSHPEDRARWQGTIERAIREKSDYDVEFRILLPDGRVKYIHTVGHPVLNSSGDLLQFVGSSTDVTDRKRADEALRRSESYLAEAQRLTRTGSWAWSVANRHSVYWSQENYRLFGFDPDEGIPSDESFYQRVHPEDRDRVRRTVFLEQPSEGSDFDVEFRIVLPDGTMSYIRSTGHPVFNASGHICEYIGTAMDVTEQHEADAALETAFEQIKVLRDQLYNENIALREEIDRSSMFEEIVGESRALQGVLANVVKVAPTDSTVLLTGETGTGKELIARAIHKRSHRAARAFVSVNCAAVPPSLIASELFGHEKGAFTGATQRRLGRFELAEGGTLFIDEVGELPLETQISLLRVLQEREFERLGGTKVIPANVRVIAATNRDLPASIDAGAFRSDLYYRLNVFPMEMPPLRERKEDIPLLVEYFIDRYASNAGKKIRGINRATLDRLKAYAWPGNIRELQNVIERSVILCETENFAVDESWLSRKLDTSEQTGSTLLRMPPSQEKKTIEAALAEAQGRISGPSGAASRLGIPPSTLDSKIRALRIDKHRFKTS
jgi:PAS domain S-box-containing protein